MLICGGVPHAGHSLANELICLPHLEHGIKAIEWSANCAELCHELQALEAQTQTDTLS